MVGHGIFTSPDMVSDMGASLWEEYPDIALGVGLKLIYYAILGVVLLVVGAAILVARREMVTVTEEVTVLLECPLQESVARVHVQNAFRGDGIPQSANAFPTKMHKVR